MKVSCSGRFCYLSFSLLHESKYSMQGQVSSKDLPQRPEVRFGVVHTLPDTQTKGTIPSSSTVSTDANDTFFPTQFDETLHHTV